jgi:exonuclease III
MDPKKILIWNVRGLSSTSRQDSVRTIVDASRVDIVCIEETKMLSITDGVLLAALGSDFSEFTAVPASGLVEGSL